ncbi:MAG: SH3 domain-containing protein [Rhodoferax sp.]|nr:SH3 domain-containing protein [Rhodoferax sp.]
MKRVVPLCAMVLSAALLVAPAFVRSAHAAQAELRVVAQGTDLWGEPDASGPVVDRLLAGQQVRVLQTSADGLWLRIARPDGTAWGYVPIAALAAVEAAAGTPPGSGAGSGGLFARSLGLATPSDTPAAATTGDAAVPADGGIFGSQVLRGDIDAAHAQRREEERLAAIRQAEAERARQQAEAQRRQQEAQERAAQAAQEREWQRQREYEAARASAEADRARQRQWAAIESSLQRITEDARRESDKTTRLIQQHARQQAQQRREREQAQANARAQREQAQMNALAQREALERAEAQKAARAREQAAAHARAQDAARAQAQAEARLRAAALTPSFQTAPAPARAPTVGAVPSASVHSAQAAPAGTAQPPAPQSGTSGAGIRIASVQRDPGEGQPGRGSMRKEGLRVGGCAVRSIQVEWSLGVLLGEATVAGTYTWQGDADCSLPVSTVVLLRLDAPGLPGGWLAVSPVVPRAGERGFNVTGSPARSALLCRYEHARRGDCLSADVARDVWTAGQVSDFVVAW